MGSEFNRIIASFPFIYPGSPKTIKNRGFHQVDYFLGGIFNHPKLGLLFFSLVRLTSRGPMMYWGIFPKIGGFYPKMDGENNGKPY